MNEEDEAFNEIERQAKQRKESVLAQLDKPKREWVGLSKGEQVLLARDYSDTPLTLIYAVGHMLKERNT